MPITLLTFDFGADEEAAQQARHRLEGWRQALRLGDRVKFRFDREAADQAGGAEAEPAEKPKKGAGKKKSDSAAQPESAAEESERFRVLIRLEFSDHEKLSYHRWLERIPAEAPFREAQKQMLSRGQEGFDEALRSFDELP